MELRTPYKRVSVSFLPQASVDVVRPVGAERATGAIVSGPRQISALRRRAPRGEFLIDDATNSSGLSNARLRPRVLSATRRPTGNDRRRLDGDGDARQTIRARRDSNVAAPALAAGKRFRRAGPIDLTHAARKIPVAKGTTRTRHVSRSVGRRPDYLPCRHNRCFIFVLPSHHHHRLKASPCRDSHGSLSFATFFNFEYAVTSARRLRSWKHDILGRPLDLFPKIFPSKMFFINVLCLNRCPINFVFLFNMCFIIFHSSFTSFNACSFVFLSILPSITDNKSNGRFVPRPNFEFRVRRASFDVEIRDLTRARERLNETGFGFFHADRPTVLCLGRFRVEYGTRSDTTTNGDFTRALQVLNVVISDFVYRKSTTTTTTKMTFLKRIKKVSFVRSILNLPSTGTHVLNLHAHW